MTTTTPLAGDIADAAVSNPADERAAKRSRVLDILDQTGHDSLLLTTNTAMTWYLGGSRLHISLAGDPVAALLVDREGDHLITFNNEADRLLREEVPADVVVHPVPWYGSLIDVARRIVPAEPLPEAAVRRELRAARQSLLPVEVAEYERLNREVARAMTDVLTASRPHTRERDVAAELASRVIALGAEPLVLLCNGKARSSFRHPLPTSSPLGRRAMAVVCARRRGMVANVTRWVRFDGSTEAELDAEARIAAVESDIFAATVPGARLNGIFDTIRRSYDAHGFGPDQWRLHHQGGPAGYAGRDPRVTEETDDAVVLNQAFTWNPSGPGVKIEDTVLVTSSGVQVLSVDERWPTVEVNGRLRPATLEI
ncbi:M24 family metallopeptidase [Arthrobacter sp. JZ12]|uniref:M24 family metallopeptidase n=1 Tax=Arthrobacter sp. JZ12 TaxID=2654190 RepID=UPI002B49EE34|nr:M24 family metallopeptidase [Arthrobacter sp. JZ12]WRH26106.1 M24 family metallopeptidase [Arthrobacter sp. JZ12]